MSFVTTVPDLIETAAGDLAGIRSTLNAATAAAAPSTTGVASAAADEVSAAIAAVFDSAWPAISALTAQAEAFHNEFVQLLNSGAASYLSTEAANVRQGLQSAVSGSTRATGAAFGAIAASGTGDIAGPYQQLFADTSANLQALGGELQANPTPLLRQFLANQEVYAQTIVAELESRRFKGFPGNVRPAIQAFIQSLEKLESGRVPADGRATPDRLRADDRDRAAKRPRWTSEPGCRRCPRASNRPSRPCRRATSQAPSATSRTAS